MEVQYCEDDSDSEVSTPYCENDVHCNSDSNSSSTSEAPERKKAKRTRFSEAQKACLNSYYSNGMTSTSKEHHFNIIKGSQRYGSQRCSSEGT